MTNEPDPVPIDDVSVGLPLQLVLGAMISQGISEIRLTDAVLAQACDKPFKAFFDETGSYIIQILR